MTPSFLELSYKHLLWLIALLASTEFLFTAIQGFLDHRADHGILWLVATSVTFGLAAVVEKVKMDVN